MILLVFISGSIQCTPEATAPQNRHEFEIANLDEITAALNLTPYHNQGASCANVDIAILDDGFDGLSEAAGKTLPPETIIQPFVGIQPQKTKHGLIMAELIYGLCTGSSQWSEDSKGPRLWLFNVNGLQNFEHTIRTLKEKNIQYVVHSRVYEFGGNFKGQGFFNQLVNQYLSDPEARWFNAAGNYNKKLFRRELSSLQSTGKHLNLGVNERFLKLQVRSPGMGKVLIAWERTGATLQELSRYNLDLALYDSEMNLIAASRKVQSEGITFRSNASKYPLEMIYSYLEKGTYFIEVTNESGDPLPADAYLNITADHYDAAFMMPQHPESSVVMPADNSLVTTIGAVDYDGSSWNLNGKPNFVNFSRTVLGDGTEIYSSSTANAIGAAATILFENSSPVFYLNQVSFSQAQLNLSPLKTTPLLVLPTP